MYVDVKAYVCVSVLNAAAGEKKKINKPDDTKTQTTTPKKKNRGGGRGGARPRPLTDVSCASREGLCRLASAEATGTEAPSLDGGQC